MADTKISALPAASALDGSELFPAVQGGSSRNVTSSQIRTLANALGSPLVIDNSGATTLTSDAFYKLVYVTAPNATITFPPATQGTDPMPLTVYNFSAGNISVNNTVIGPGRKITHLSRNAAWQRVQDAVDGTAASMRYPAPYPGQQFSTAPQVWAAAAGAPPAALTPIFQVFSLPFSVAIQELSVYVAGAVATAKFMLGVYENVFDPGNGLPKPGNLICVGSNTDLDGGTIGWRQTPVAGGPLLPAGVRLWAALMVNTGSVTFRCDNSGYTAMLVGNLAVPATPTNGAPGWRTQTPLASYGTLPTSMQGIPLSAGGPYYFLNMRAL